MGLQTDKLKTDTLVNTTLAPRANGLLDWSGKAHRKLYSTGQTIAVPYNNGQARFAYCPVNGYLYVSLYSDTKAIKVINLANNSIVATISTNTAAASFLLYVPTENRMYFYDQMTDNLCYIDCTTNTFNTGYDVTPIIEYSTLGLAYCPTNNCIYCVAESEVSEVYKFSLASHTIVSTIVVPMPVAIAYCPANDSMWVSCRPSQTNSDEQQVWEIACSTGIPTLIVPAIRTPGRLMYNCVNESMYVTINGLPGLAEITCDTYTVSTINDFAGVPPRYFIEALNCYVMPHSWTTQAVKLLDCSTNTTVASLPISYSYFSDVIVINNYIYILDGINNLIYIYIYL